MENDALLQNPHRAQEQFNALQAPTLFQRVCAERDGLRREIEQIHKQLRADNRMHEENWMRCYERRIEYMRERDDARAEVERLRAAHQQACFALRLLKDGKPDEAQELLEKALGAADSAGNDNGSV